MTASAPVDVLSTAAIIYSPDFILRLKARDIQAFTTLYDDYSGALFALTYRATCNSSSAESILQHTFVKIWLTLPDYNPEKSGIYSWMMSITRNEIVEHYRLSGSKKITPNSNEQDPTSSLKHEVIIRPGVKNIVKAASTNEKVMLDLLYFKGYSINETASLMNMPKRSVKTQVMAFLRNWRPLMNFLYHNNSAHTE